MHSEQPKLRSGRRRLTPAIADVRRAVRAALAPFTGQRVLVALSGGADSLALAAATAFEASRAGIGAGAVIVDHQLQPASADVAARAARQATALGLHPVRIIRVQVGSAGGPEAAARAARYRALAEAADQTGAIAVLLGHTLDDQAETVLLGLARGSGAASLRGMAASSTARPDADRDAESADQAEADADAASAEPGAALTWLRPLLGIRRATTAACCADSGLEPWHDPHNTDHAYRRVRVRERVMPTLEAELGPGVAEALARTAAQLREDSELLDRLAEQQLDGLAEPIAAGVALPAEALAEQPPALRNRIIRLAVHRGFQVSLSHRHTVEVARLVSDWHGQGPVHLPGIRVVRADGRIVFNGADDQGAAEWT